MFSDGSDATRRAIDAAYCHPLSVPALTRQAIKRLQRSAVPASKLACTSAADPQRRYARNESESKFMNTGNKDDLSNTKSVAKSVMPGVSRGKTWLGHFENRQSGLIDLLILEGIYSVKEIAIKVERAFPGVTDSVRRVEDHIEHLLEKFVLTSIENANRVDEVEGDFRPINSRQPGVHKCLQPIAENVGSGQRS